MNASREARADAACTAAEPTILFSDIEGSTRLWESHEAQMAVALAWHDEIVAHWVTRCRGRVVKTTGDGVHAVFDDPVSAVQAALGMQRALAAPGATQGLALKVRCGLHAGPAQQRAGDVYGPAVNRAARIMAAAHGGQTLLSQALAERLAPQLSDARLDGATLRDLGRVRLRDLSSPERMFQLVHAGLRAEFPPLRSLEGTPNNLPQQLNSFIGREGVLAQAARQLAGCRLLTLLGMGGIGKSRLSVQLGAALLDDFPDGVWLVELAPLTDARLVPQALANVLGLKDEGGEAVAELLVRYLRDKRVLLILDNCEHVAAAVAALAKQLLQTASGLKLLATSRSALQIAGEITCPVPTLDVPGMADGAAAPAEQEADALLQHEAVRLFVDRAGAVQAGFELTAANAAAVTEICRALDGIPLAIELAAARIRTLPAQAIAERLGDRFRLLSTRDETVLPRQRTLRALIDWSFDLLPEGERRLFRRLSVFAGGCTLAAAEGVCAGDGLPEDEVLDRLSLLVEMSLVALEPERGRYRMLETVRHYAHEKLQQAGELASLSERHLHWHVALAEQARPQLAGAEQGLWLSRLDLERDNFLAAHRASASLRGGDGLALRLMHALRPYWIDRGKLSLGLGMAEELLARMGLQARDSARCMALFGAGQMSVWMGRHLRAHAYLTECLAIAREIGDQAIVARVLQPLGILGWQMHDYEASQALLEEALDRARQLGEAREIAGALIALAILCRIQGRLGSAAPLLAEAVSIAQQLGDQHAAGIGLLNHAMVQVNAGRYREAATMLDEAASLAAATGSQTLVAGCIETCVGLAAALRRWVAAAEFLGAAEGYRLEMGQPRDHGDQIFLNPWVAATHEAQGADAAARHASAGRGRARADALAWVRAWLLDVARGL